jgi:hypothetical protein
MNCIYVFPKEAEMVMSRILGADMILLFFLRFLIKRGRGIKAAGCFVSFLGANNPHNADCLSLRLFISKLFTQQIPYSCLLLNSNERVRGEN